MKWMFRGKDFLDIADFAAEEIQYLLQTAIALKRRLMSGERLRTLEGKTLALLFEKPSLRTRVSFEMAMAQLGGASLYLGPEEVGLGKREAVKDVAQVLARMVDAIMLRTFDHNTVLELAHHCEVPVINGLSDLHHPCQVLGDLLTILEKKGKVQGVEISFVGDGNNLCHSWLAASSVLGLNLTVSTPVGFRPDAGIWEQSETLIQSRGGRLRFEPDPRFAVKETDVIYTDVWTSMGKEKEAEDRIVQFRPFQVNRDLLSRAGKEVMVMHCMPAHRGQEITDEVMDGPFSVCIDQAENRLHAQKALLALLLG